MNMQYLGYAVGIAAVIFGMYHKIRYDCLELASKKVAEAESHTELSGEERAKLANEMIRKELPLAFIDSLVRNFLAKIIDYAYKNSKEFAEGYAKVKTGESIENIVDKLSTIEDTKAENTESDDSGE